MPPGISPDTAGLGFSKIRSNLKDSKMMPSKASETLTLQQLSEILRTPRIEGSEQVTQSMKRVAIIADLLDNRFKIPGTDYRVGWDPILGLIPVVGDTLTTVVGAFIVREAVRVGARKRTIARMFWNLSLDWLVGLVPFLDIVFDVGFKANARNARLLVREWEAGHLKK
jgi:hypothetical protein